MAEQKLSIKWPEVEKELDNLRAVQGGFSQAQRGLLTLPDGTQVFVKLGLADKLGVDLEKAFIKTMDELDNHLEE